LPHLANNQDNVKKLATVLSFLAVVVLGFTACENKATVAEGGSNNEISAEAAEKDVKIAYVLTDSLIAKYEFFIQKSGEITAKGKKFEGELSTRARGFEQEVANFQQTAASMTPNQARAKEEDLVKKERNLMTYRDNLMQELSAEEAKLYSDVYDQIQEYLKNYAEQNGLDMILSYTKGGAVWYSNNTLDITEKVIQGLNKKFSENQPSSTSTK
jgi:outer membrane protein